MTIFYSYYDTLSKNYKLTWSASSFEDVVRWYNTRVEMKLIPLSCIKRLIPNDYPKPTWGGSKNLTEVMSGGTVL